MPEKYIQLETNALALPDTHPPRPEIGLDSWAQWQSGETYNTTSVARPSHTPPEKTPLEVARDQAFQENYGEYALKFKQEPTTVEVTGLGPVKGWTNPGMDDTSWEIFNNVDVLGPRHESYNYLAERIVLDWDDTCKDTGKYWILAHREVLQEFGFTDEETSDENILSLFGNIRVANTLGLDRFVKDGQQYSDDEIWGKIKGSAREMLKQNPMDPLLVEALKQTKGSLTNLAIWSSSPRELLEEAVAANGLEGIFDAIISVDDVKEHKPDPEGLLKAVYAMDVARGYLQPGEEYSPTKPCDMNGVWMIGDSPNDVKGGQAAGANTVAIEHPLQAHSSLEKRQKAMAQAALIGRTALEDTAHKLRPTLSIRNFDLREDGMYGDVPVDQLSRDSVAKLTTDNVSFARFLIDPALRHAVHRQVNVYDALLEQGYGDKAKLKGLFNNRDSRTRTGPKLTKEPYTVSRARGTLKTMGETIDQESLDY
ncbi:MAG: HAD hydrolase-like protein [Candidatus Saccharibacteria bacterium]